VVRHRSSTLPNDGGREERAVRPAPESNRLVCNWPYPEVRIVVKESGYGGRAENICSFRGLPFMTDAVDKGAGDLESGPAGPVRL
jgi:hypothetical protein